MSQQPKWTEERTAQLNEIVGTVEPVSLDKVAEAAEILGNSTRSISSKLRKLGMDVESVAAKSKSFSDAEEEALISFVNANPLMYTFKEIASSVMGSEDFYKKVQGKLLSLELTDKVKKAEPKEVVLKYNEDEEAVIANMANDGSYIEDIAEALGRDIKSIRGKVLSMLKTHGIPYPQQKNKKEKANSDPFAAIEDIEEKTVAVIAETIGKSERGVKTMLTHRGISVADYDGAKKAAKNAEKKAA
jgi:hypothetical protein